MSLEGYHIVYLAMMASSILILVAVVRVWMVVRHWCLLMLGAACILACLSVVLGIIAELAWVNYEWSELLWNVNYGVWALNYVTWTIGLWQLLHWIPQLLELKALDQRDAPFEKIERP